MRFLLDTDHVSILERPADRGYPALVANLNLHVAEGVGVSLASVHEQMLGAHARIQAARSPADLVRGCAHLARVVELCRQFPVVAFDPAAAEQFELLRAAKVRIGTMDLRIAATARSRGLVVVTRNRSDFGQVPGLVLADWSR